MSNCGISPLFPVLWHSSPRGEFSPSQSCYGRQLNLLMGSQLKNPACDFLLMGWRGGHTTIYYTMRTSLILEPYLYLPQHATLNMGLGSECACVCVCTHSCKEKELRNSTPIPPSLNSHCQTMALTLPPPILSF